MTTDTLTSNSPDINRQEPFSIASPEQASEPPETNVGGQERALSIAAGAALGVLGLKIRGLTGLALIAGSVGLVKRGYSGHCELNSMLGRNSARAASAEDYFERGIQVEAAFTIQKPRQELYDYWHNFENLPTFMHHVKTVRRGEGGLWHWEIDAPAGMTVKWDAEIVNDVPGEVIAWRSVDGADVDNAGSVRFVEAPGERGTEVRVTIDYIPPGGTLGKWAATLFGKDPKMLIRSDLRRFKQLMEAGAIPTIEGQSMGTCSC